MGAVTGKRKATAPPQGPLSGVQVYVGPRLHNRAGKIKIWDRALARLGGSIQAKAGSGFTHVVVEAGSSDVEELSDAEQAGGTPFVVEPKWLEVSLAMQERQPEDQYRVQPKPKEEPASADAPPPRGNVYWDEKEQQWETMPHHGRWLGHWSNELEGADQMELMLQPVYSIERCREKGNDAIFQALKEMTKYEMALDAEGDYDHPAHDKINYRALKYARAAAAVQACNYKIDSSLKPSQIPFCGPAITKQIQALVDTGTCTQLQQFRNDEPVTDSSGDVRAGTEGAATRKMFKALPGVGTRMALHWWQAGFRSYDDMEEACEPGGAFGSTRNNVTISKEAYFSLMHRHELLEDVPPADFQEMKETVLQALRNVAGEGWRLIDVGGAARGLPSHDADFLVTHDSNRPAEGVVKDVAAELVRMGRLWPGLPESAAMHRIQTGRMPGHVDRMKAHFLGDNSAPASNLAADRFDHLFGMYKTAAGATRRLDLIFVPPEELPFATLGWTGSRQFLRFMRGHACGALAMHLNSHRLLAQKDGVAWVVPDEGPPTDRNGQQRWPQGWDENRRVMQESDIFELMFLPYHPGPERNCP